MTQNEQKYSVSGKICNAVVLRKLTVTNAMNTI